VTVEDHSVIGGLGGSVSEFLSRNIPTPLEMVGVDDRFGESGGTSELMSHLNIDSKAIENAVKAVIKRK
jgi:transketolase